MKKNFCSSSIALTIIIFSGTSNLTYADEKQNEIKNTEEEKISLESMVISADTIDEPFKKTDFIRNNLGNANDGADLLKQSPGITVIRQGGAASDPLLRGLGGSRLNISIDGVPFSGACNHRMDPATAYVSPGTFNSLTLLKGPQSVRYGNSIVGTVNFDREPIKYENLGVRSFASYLYGSFNQQGLTVDASTGFNQGYIAYTHNNSRSGNYENGEGKTIDLTFYDTANDRIAIGYTPDDDTLLEISGLSSKGEMGNATIHMDVTRLDRQNYDLHFKKENFSSWLKELDIRYAYTNVDHAMDNYTLRELKPFHDFIVMGQYWERHFAKLESTFEINSKIQLVTGMEYRNDSYDANAKGGSLEFDIIPANISHLPKDHILDFDNFAAYAELSYQANPNLRWVAGLRGDTLGTRTGAMTAGGQVSSLLLSGANKHRRQTLMAGFLRAEYMFEELPIQLSAGYGHAERAADYWEVFSMDGFDLDAEKNNEFDIMLSYRSGNFDAEISAFYSHISDFILVHQGASALNVDAHRTGGELSLSYAINESLTLQGNLSYVYGENLSQNTPLAQTPPLEGNIGINYKQGSFSGLVNTRLVDNQSRIHSRYGNVLSLDSTPTVGFIVTSFELGYQPHRSIELKFGVDNLFNKNYSEHISRNASANVGGPSTKINEPGRAYWGRIVINFDYPG